MAERLGRYELLRKIAIGGMADVFVALQWGDGAFVRRAVVKRLHAHLAEQAEVLLSFENEAKILAMLQHPGVPHVYDFRCRDGVWFLAMEHAAGPTLADVGRSPDPLPTDVALAVLKQLAEVLGHVHNTVSTAGEHLGLVHGDLTPANVVLRPDGRVSLLDFGIASTVDQRESGRRAMRGTAGYMAPEQVRSSTQVDHRADVYQLGVLLFETTTGSKLHKGDDIAYMRAVTEGALPLPSERKVGYPKPLEGIVRRALSTEAGDRYTSAFELRDAVGRFAAAHDHDTSHAVIARFVGERFSHHAPVQLPPEAAPPAFEEDTSQHAVMDVSDLVDDDDDVFFDEDLPEHLSAEEHAELLADLDVFAD